MVVGWICVTGFNVPGTSDGIAFGSSGVVDQVYSPITNRYCSACVGSARFVSGQFPRSRTPAGLLASPKTNDELPPAYPSAENCEPTCPASGWMLNSHTLFQCGRSSIVPTTFLLHNVTQQQGPTFWRPGARPSEGDSWRMFDAPSVALK